MRIPKAAVALCWLAGFAVPAGATTLDEDLDAAKRKLTAIQKTMADFKKGNVEKQNAVSDPNSFVISLGDRTARIRADEVGELAKIAVKVLAEIPEAAPALRAAFPDEVEMLEGNGIKLDELSNPQEAASSFGSGQVLMPELFGALPGMVDKR